MTPKVPSNDSLGAASPWQSTATGESSVVSSSEDPESGERGRLKRCQPSSKTGPAKKRRSTYDIRKQQKSDLMAEITTLENQLNLLKHRMLREAIQPVKRTEAANSVLQEYTEKHHVRIARVQAMLIAQMQQSLSTLHPTQTFIRLGSDRGERQKTLVAMKDRKLREAEGLISAWNQGLDPTSTVSQENRFESADGGFSVVRFDNAPIHGSSIREVYDAIIHSMQNAEIIISELFGSITIREDTEFDARDIFQLRLVSSTAHGATLESNSVIFSEFVDGQDGSSYGIVAADFVDADDVFPYRPDQRLRRDAITIVAIKSVPCLDGENHEVVVGTRWTCLKLTHTELDIPKSGISELQESSMAWGDTMKKCIMQYVAKNKK